MANRHFVFFQLKAVRKPWWNHKPLPFFFTKYFSHAIESFYRPLVMSTLSFIFTETFRWQIFYTVNYRRQLIKDELPISNVYHYQASWLFQDLCLFTKPNRVSGNHVFSLPSYLRSLFLVNLQFFEKNWRNSTFLSISWSIYYLMHTHNSQLLENLNINYRTWHIFVFSS